MPKKHKEAAWKTTDIPGICLSFCKQKIQLMDDKKLVVQRQRRLNPNMQEVVKKSITEGIKRRIDYSLIRLKNQRCKVLYKVEDIATCLLQYVKFWDDWEVDRYPNANLVIMEYLELVLPQYAVSIKKIRRIRAYTSPDATKDSSPIRRIQKTNTPYWKYGMNIIFWKISSVIPTLRNPQYVVTMDDPNITMEEYIMLEEEKARRREKVYNWETATYAIVFNDTLTSEASLSCEPTVSSLNNDEIDFRISFYESDDEDYTPTVSYFDDLDFFKDFENEFSAIVYNDAQTSKSDLLTELILNPQHIDEFNLKDETSLSECDEEEQNVLNFNDLFPFNIIYPDELKTDMDNDNDKVDIEHSSGDLSVKPLPNVINTEVGPRERKIDDVGDVFTNLEIMKCWSLETSRRLFNT
ncbi:hypothetical protein Tco_0541366 [Tanacetum coccineum]